MKILKLKKVKISKIGNPHILFGGAELTAQGGNYGVNYDEYPITYTLDTKLDGDCIPHTNGGNTLGRTGGIALNQDVINNGIKN